jgi:hypothetical protein
MSDHRYTWHCKAYDSYAEAYEGQRCMCQTHIIVCVP